MFMMSVQSRLIAKRYPEFLLLPWVFAVSVVQMVVIRHQAVGHDWLSVIYFSAGTVLGAFIGTRLVNNFLYSKVFGEK